MAYSPLGRSFFADAVHDIEDLPNGDGRRNHPRFQGDNFERNWDLLDEVRAIAREKGIADAQLALAWVLSRGDDVVPIPGTKRRRYLEENVGAADVELTGEELDRIEAAFPKGATAGERYADMSTIDA